MAKLHAKKSEMPAAAATAAEVTEAEQPRPAPAPDYPSIKQEHSRLNLQDARTGIIMSEIFGPPLSKRRRYGRWR